MTAFKDRLKDEDSKESIFEKFRNEAEPETIEDKFEPNAPPVPVDDAGPMGIEVEPVEILKPDSLVDIFTTVSVYVAQITKNDAWLMPDQVAARLSRAWVPVINLVLPWAFPKLSTDSRIQQVLEKLAEPVTRSAEYAAGVWKNVYTAPQYVKRNKFSFDGLGKFWNKEPKNGKEKEPKSDDKK